MVVHVCEYFVCVVVDWMKSKNFDCNICKHTVVLVEKKKKKWDYYFCFFKTTYLYAFVDVEWDWHFLEMISSKMCMNIDVYHCLKSMRMSTAMTSVLMADDRTRFHRTHAKHVEYSSSTSDSPTNNQSVDQQIVVFVYTHFYFQNWTKRKTTDFILLPMFVQCNETLKCLQTIFTINNRSYIDMQTFMSTEIRKLRVRFRTELTFPWFYTRMNIPMLF